MTELLYYEDPHLLEFEAQIQETRTADGAHELVLDRTAFYPEGGGQPADTGEIAGHPVLHVRKDDGDVIHVVKAQADALPSGTVRCRVDPARRRDYRQQHTGQHILSAALMQVGPYNTVSVHQGDEYTTIEIDAGELPEEDLREVERIANAAIEADLPVTATWVTDAEIDRYPLRRPPKVSGSIRIVQVGDLDCVACGGVHASRTGEVRLVHAMSVETIRGHVRIAWKIGDRALTHYARTSRIVSRLCSDLSAQPDEIVERVQKQEARIREGELENRRLRKRLYELVAHSLEADAQIVHGQRIVTAEFHDEPKDFLRGVAEELVAQTGVAACLTNHTGDQLQWTIGIAPGSSLSFAELRDELFPIIEAKGGGKPPLWQGVGGRTAGTHEFLAAFRRLGEEKLGGT